MGRHRGRRRRANVLQHLEPRLLLSRVELVYEPDTSTASAFPTTGYEIAMNGQDAYFTAESSGGRELWASDGTEAGTHMVKDIIPGPAGITPQSLFVPFGSITLFDANVQAGTTATETWRTDGTEAGTYPLTYGTSNAWDFQLAGGTARLGSLLYGSVRNRDTGRYTLGVTDGTTAGTRPLSATRSETPFDLRVVDGIIYFTGIDGAGKELWQSDGTAAGTFRLADLRPGSESSNPSNLVAANHQLYFTADNGVTGREWWAASPNGVYQIGNLQAGAASVSVYSAAAIDGVVPQANGVLLFYTPGIGSTGAALWRSDGTTVGTYRLQSMASPVYGIQSAGTRAYFMSGNALWTTNGTVSGTVPIKTADGYAPLVTNFGVLGDRVVFRGSTASQGNELWISDGTAAGTSLLKDIAPGSAGSNPWRLASNPAGGRVFFAADANDGKGMELWATDGTAAGTYAVADVNRVTPSSQPWGLTKVGDQAFYYVQQNGPYRGLWQTDGTAAGTGQVSDVYLQVEPGYVRQTAALGGRLFFSGVAPGTSTGFELFVSDGTAAGTRMVKDINPGSGSSNPRNMTVVGQEVYFLAGPSYGLYRADASGADATVVATGVPDNVNTVAVVGEWLYFATGTTIGPGTLWRVRAGSPAEQVVTLDTIEGVYNLHGRLIVQVRTLDRSETLLYESDGTAAGTRQIAYLGFPHTVVGPLRETPFGAVFGAGGTAYATDLTTAGTRRIFSNKFVHGVTVYGGQTYLQLKSGWDALQPGDGLYVTDGTEAGTRLVKAGLFYPQDAVVDGRMFFPGFEAGAADASLYESDGTEGGTRVAADLVPGPYNFDFQPLVALDRTLVFVADDNADHGQEVWRVNPDVTAPAVLSADFQYAATGGPQVRVQFSERVAASLTAAGLVLTDPATGQAVPVTAARVDYDSATDTATFTLPPNLPDGNYRATLAASDPSGNPLAAAAAVDFFTLAGDANRDRRVNFSDLAILAQNYNQSGRTFAQGDFNYDGTVNFSDLAILAQRYNVTLPAPPSSAVVALAPAPAAVTDGFDVLSSDSRRPVFSTAPVARPATPRPTPRPKPG